jgi:hypothetical protein
MPLGSSQGFLLRSCRSTVRLPRARKRDTASKNAASSNRYSVDAVKMQKLAAKRKKLQHDHNFSFRN